MNLPPSSKTPNPPQPTTTSSECSNCSTQERFLIHNVRLRGLYRRLCTSCVLKLHSSSFCPSCFTLFESHPPHHSKRICCSNCNSFTHSHCAPSPPPLPFLCPPCSNPDFEFFPINQNNRALDKSLAAALLCAAKIAASSMAKGVVVAKVDAERKVKEAAVFRKRAREALENVAFVANKEKMMMVVANAAHKSKDVVESSLEVSGSGNLRRVEGVAVKSVHNGNLAQFGNGLFQGDVSAKEDKAS